MRLPSRRVGPVLLALVGIVAVAIALTSSSGGRIPDGSGGITVVRSEPDGTIRAHHCAKHSEVGEDPRCPGDRRSFQRWLWAFTALFVAGVLAVLSSAIWRVRIALRRRRRRREPPRGPLTCTFWSG